MIENWKHRAFPALTPAEAEACVEGLPDCELEQLEWIVTASEKLPVVPHIEPPAHLADIETHELYQRYLFGSDPIPDLATAEYIRRELQSVLALWARDCTRIQSMVVANVLGQEAKRPDAQRRRYALWRMSGGDIACTGVIKDIARRLDSAPEICAKFGFPEGRRNKKPRTTAVRELIKVMREAVKAGDRPYTLSADEENKLSIDLDFVDLTAEDRPKM